MNAQNPIRRITDNVYLLWAVLAWPALYVFLQFFVWHGPVPYVPLTGDLSAWLMILTLAVTPLMMLVGPLPWLKARRRYFGVASFGYAVLHLLFWLKGAHWWDLIHSFKRFEILVGWGAMGLMGLLAVTSNDWSVRKMGTMWKALQRWVYPAAILTLIHWALTTHDRRAMVVYTMPLILLTIWRIFRTKARASRV